MDPFETLLPALERLDLGPGPERALAEGVAPLLYYAAPAQAALRLRKAYYETAARNLALLDALEEAASRLATAGIEPIVLKGADLATSLYPNLALRPMSDVDLWVEPDELAEAERVLLALGYRPGCPEMTPGLARAVKHARLYVKGPSDSIAIDLHWSLIGGDEDVRSPDLSWFRRHALRGRLDTTAHLLYLAAHVKLQHYDEPTPLVWLCDFFLLAHRENVAWDELLAAARSFGWSAALAETAAEARERLGVPLPEPLQALPRERPTADRPRVPERKGGPERAWNELTTLDWTGRLRLVRGYLLPSPSYVQWRYRPRPAWCWPLYYPLRWAGLVAAFLHLASHRRRSGPVLGKSPS